MASIGDLACGGDAVAVTPSDTARLEPAARALYIGSFGNVTLVTAAGNTVAFVGLQPGTVLPVRARQVRATGTTATNIVALI